MINIVAGNHEDWHAQLGLVNDKNSDSVIEGDSGQE